MDKKTWTDISMKRDDNHMKRCPTSILIKEMQNKTTVSITYPSIMVKIKNSDNTKYLQGYEEIGSHVAGEDVKQNSYSRK